MAWRRLNVAEIDAALAGLDGSGPDAGPEEAPLTADALRRLGVGYAYVGELLRDRRNIFRYGETRPILELNHRVLCGVTPERREEFKDHIAETEKWFYDRPGAGIGALIDWYQRNRTSPPEALAAGVLAQTVSSPQLFIEGNSRTGTLLASYILARGGFPPLVVTEASRPRYTELVDWCVAIDRGGLIGAMSIGRVTHQIAIFLRDTGDPRFLEEEIHEGKAPATQRSP